MQGNYDLGLTNNLLNTEHVLYLLLKLMAVSGQPLLERRKEIMNLQLIDDLFLHNLPEINEKTRK